MLNLQKNLLKIKDKYIAKKKSQKGFTLIELIIVIVIIALLVAIAVSDFSRDTEEAKKSRAKADLKTLASAAQLYYTETGKEVDENNFCKTLQGTDTKIEGGTAGPWLKTCPISPWNGHEYKVVKRTVGEDEGKHLEFDFEVTSPNEFTLSSQDLAKAHN